MQRNTTERNASQPVNVFSCFSWRIILINTSNFQKIQASSSNIHGQKKSRSLHFEDLKYMVIQSSFSHSHATEECYITRASVFFASDCVKCKNKLRLLFFKYCHELYCTEFNNIFFNLVIYIYIYLKSNKY